MKGSRVGPYLLLTEVGSGGMGTVWLAHDEEEDRAVALKVMHPALSERGGFFRRFEREAEAGMRVEDPHVVRTLDFGLHMLEGRALCYLVTEFVAGRTLRALLHELGALPEALVREIARQTAAGLAAIHAAGVVHRDVKPDNVLITDDEQVRIMDLGVAKVLDAAEALTHEGQFAGSLAYAAPEQFGAPQQAVDHRADLYSLGVLLYELVAGRNPFVRETSAAVVRAHLDETPPDLTDASPDASSFLSAVVATLLDKDAARRFASAGALLAVLGEGERSAWWAERQDAWRRRRSRVPRVPVRRETVLHGREEDLALLAELWTKARAGDGSTLLVEGEAGIGKSRLVDAFVETLAGQDAHVLYGSYAPAGGLGGLADAVVQRFGAAGLDAALAPYLAPVPSLVPAFAALLRDRAPPEGAAALQGDALHAVFAHLLRGLAAETPVVWVVEDLHFASQDARRIALSLARAVPGRRVLLVLTSRPPVPEEEAALLGRAASFRRTRLARLGAREVVRLLRDALRNEHLVEKLAPRIAEKSDGVPFFVFEMIRGLQAGQFLTELPDGTWVESKVIDRIEVPSAVRDLIAARLADVPTQVREVLDVASVQGYEFDPDLSAAVLERRPLAVLQALARIERRSGVVRAADGRYRFDHHQIQEVVHDALPPRLREEYHAAVAEALERRAGAAAEDPAALDGALCVDLAEHFLEGARGDRALRYLDAALTHLEEGYRHGGAVALADRALASAGLLAGPRRVGILLRKADRLDFLGRRDAQREALEQALAIADAGDERTVRARVRNALGAFLLSVSRWTDAHAVLAEALAHAQAAGDPKAEAQAYWRLGNASHLLGRYDEALMRHGRYLALARRTGDRRGETNATGNLGSDLHALGRYAEARSHFEEQFALARATGDRRGEALAAGNLGLLCFSCGRQDDALAHHERQIALAREIGDRRIEADACGRLGGVLHALGRHAEAQARHERHMALAREIGDRQGEARATGNLGSALSSVGRHAEALEHHARHAALARDIGDRRGEAIAVGSQGNVCVALGRSADARDLYERQLALAREIRDRRGEALALAGLGLLWVALGRAGRARSCLDASLALCRELGARYPEGFVLAGLGAVCDAEGDTGGAERLSDEALVLRRAIGDGHGVVDSLLTIADRRRREGDAAGARTAAEEALSLARSQGRPGQAAVARALLACLPGGDVDAACAAASDVAESGDSVGVRFLLWQATRDPAHLAEAKRLLDFLVEHAPEDCRESMLANVRLHREIAAAAAETGL